MTTNNEKGINFEKACLRKLEEIGFSELTLTNNTDNGVDIIGIYNKTKYAFQCKNHIKAQGNKCVQEIVSAMSLYKCNRAVVISNSIFTSAAKALAKANNCILILASDFFKLTDFPPLNYVEYFQDDRIYEMDYDILVNYEKTKRIVGRIPKWSELDKTLQYNIRKKYGNYTTFTKELGVPKYSIRPSDEEIRREYLRVKAIIGKVPRLKDIKENSDFALNSFREYPFTVLQKECGDRPYVQRGVSKETLKQAYFDLEKQLKHSPTITEIDEKGEYKSSYYRNRWGGFNEFLVDIGKTRTQAGLPRVYTQEDILLIYLLIKMLLSYINEDDYIVNHTTLEKLKYDEKCLISPSTISKKFDGWENFINYANENGFSDLINNKVEELRKKGLKSFFDI